MSPGNRRSRRKLWLFLGGLAVLAIVGLLAVPALIDVNRYRGLIEAKARDTLGRDVRLGEMKLSVLPVLGVRVDDLAIGALPGEGSGDLLTAEHLRVGARLLPLLGGRLEVTSLVIDAPRLRLERGGDGRWNVSRLLAPTDSPEGATDRPRDGRPDRAGRAFRVGKLRVRDGRVAIRDAGPGRRTPVEATLTDVDLTLTDLSPDRPVGIDLSAALEGAGGASVTLDGRVGPLSPPAGQRSVVEGRIDARRLDPERLAPLLDGVVRLPKGLIGKRPFSLAAGIQGEISPETSLALSGVVIRDLEVHLVRPRRGEWNLPQEGPGEEGGKGPGGGLTLSGFDLAGATIHVRDEAVEGEVLELTLDDLRLKLDRLPAQGRTAVDLAGTLRAGDGEGPLSVKGHIGPSSPDGASLPLDIALSAEKLPAALLRRFVGGEIVFSGRGSGADLKADLSGAFPESVDAKGTLALRGAEITLDGAKPRRLPLDLTAAYDIGSQRGGSALQIRALQIDTSGHRLSLRGSLREEGAARRVDMELLPSKIRAGDLAALLALASGEPPFSISSSEPVELHVRARGLVGGGRSPDLEGRAKVRAFSLHHPTMAAPLERVDADITLKGQRVDVDLLAGAMGSSDIKGSIGVEGFDRPRIGFDLRSDRADFDELFSFLRPADETGGGAGAGGGGPDGPGLTLSGRIRIGAGSFQTLDFTQLDAGLRFAEGVVTVDPLSLALYGGTFTGRIRSDLTTGEPRTEVRGTADGVDTDAFLADNLGSRGLLTGRFSGKVDLRASGSDYESIVRGLAGSGRMQVSEGAVGKLDVLKTLSKVSGVFGETTLKSFSGRMAKEGTAFTSLKSGVRFEGARMLLEDLLLDAPDFQLTGGGAVDLLSQDLRGQFRLSLSPAVSGTMRSEGSRAAEVFWNARQGRVEVPFTLSGPFTAPTPGVDFGGAVRATVRDRADEKVRDLLGDRLGVRPTAPAQEGGGGKPSAAAPTPRAAATSAPAGDSDLAAELFPVEWGDSPLAPDLSIRGQVRGTGIKKVSLRVTDARGVELESIDQLPEVRKYKSSAGKDEHGTVRFKETIEGKRLLLARYPVEIRAVVQNQDGQSAEAVLRVER